MKIIIFIFVFFLSTAQGFAGEEYCAFCDQKVLDYQTFYEDELVSVLYTHKPILAGHCLIIPKRHVERFEMLTEEEMVHITRAIKKVDLAVQDVFQTSSYLLLQKNGKEVGQTVFHVHFHYIPRKENDSSSLTFLLKMFIANAKSPISPEHMKEFVGHMKEAIASKEGS